MNIDMAALRTIEKEKSIPVEDMLPAGGQGIIGVTLHVDAPDWLRTAVAATDNHASRLAAVAERAFLRRHPSTCMASPFSTGHSSKAAIRASIRASSASA